MLFAKSFEKWTTEEKKNFAKDAISYAKEAGLPLKKKKKSKQK
ncbi:hypothetical protein [Paenibacillus alkaliterrae]|nr:hypothetical protein [Paenibacillus alkaliterrae]